ncbi:hypothetical protein [Aestuariivirga sp.]|uniref:hypothetical protein n=1 Tax=Aestuariivirga sp. TaxID=2650926 RepID=UPI003592EDCB
MAKKKQKVAEGFVFFDVVYEDGTRSSRRKVAAAEIEEHGEAHAKTAIMDQDRKIAEMSGNSRGPVKTITRSDG